MASDPDGRRDAWSAAGLAVVAIVYLAGNRQHPLDTLTTPGSGLFPLMAGATLLGLAVWRVATALRRPRGVTATAAERAAPGRLRAPLVMSGVLAGYAAALPVLGFLPTSFALVFIAARLMGLSGWWRPAALAVGVTAVTHVLFAVWLGVPLPAGRLR